MKKLIMPIIVVALLVCAGNANAASWWQKASAAQSLRLAAIDKQYAALSAKITAKYNLNTSLYKKLAAKSTAALNYNRLANSLKYNHGYAVNAVYKGYYPYTTRAIKGANYVSTATLARMQLAALKLKLRR